MNTSFIASLILCNVYMVLAISDFLNQHITLIFSFLLFILLFEYIDTAEENDKRKNIIKLSAVFIFPILAIMAQGHFFTFFSMIPTVIVYLIIKYKRTLKYILYWSLGVFISFLEYLPYLISEIQSNFSNLKMAMSIRDSFSSFPFPQIYLRRSSRNRIHSHHRVWKAGARYKLHSGWYHAADSWGHKTC